MCGIAGFISKKFTEHQLQQMTRRIGHRGPDAEGFFFDTGCGTGLGHKRLSILDLSEAANQPFFSRDGRYVMIYNGEVYNYKEVASKYNLHTRTTSDTEVIIEAFAKVGVQCISDLNGMFALAIWDKLEEKLYLVRDRVGIKPLYYFHQEGQFAFASELKALFTLPVSKKINHDAVADFLYLGYIPGNSTIYNDFQKLLPGYYAVYQNGMLASYPYWWLDSKLEKKVLTNETEAREKLKQLLESSVQYCMISDVPLGIFLSGGVDSSIVAAIAQSASSVPVKTFSIGFKEGKYNEAHFAQQVASHIRSEHHEFTVTEQDALHLVEKMLDIYDEPYADSSAIPTYMVSQLARKEVTVALSGDGGDELFMGYGFYNWSQRLGNPFVKAFRQTMAAGLHTFGNNRSKRASYMFRYPSRARKKSHIFSQEQYYFTESELQSLLKKPGRITLDEYNCSSKRKLTVEEEQSFFDIKNYLPEELLVKTDRASMCHSLEVRVPLLDYRLVEFAVNLSPSLKLRGSTGKYLLKEVLYEYVPASLFNRPKWGFSVPLSIWLTRELRYLFDKYLDPVTVQECGLVNAAVVEKIKNDFFAGKDYFYNRLWTLILLHKWFKENHS
jgi:asparagine synthase (glutamine-hydrolysing)